MRYTGKARFLAGTSCAALAIACWLAAPVSAATYLVSNETDLRNAIAAANASPDASSTIVLTQSFTVTTAPNLTTPTKTLTIDTQGFTLSGAGASSITVNGNFPSGSLTLSGTLVGGTGGVGLVVNSGITTVGASTGQVVNNGSITGGAAASGGLGVSLINVVTFLNNGAISGGTGTGAGVGNNGAGVNILNSGATLINNASGTIQGSNSQAAGHVGAGVYVSTLAKAATITNYGTIRGGRDISGVGAGEAAILGRGSQLTTIVNAGTLEGGNGAAAIAADATTWNVAVINSGTIRAGIGQNEAIRFGQTTASRSALELQAGSVIQGNVIANASVGLFDTLRLGGTANASFDVSAIGPAAQYQNFDVFEKTGTSAWTLTGIGDFAGPTNIAGGTLLVNGSLAGSAVTVQSGATLGGSGTVGATTLLSGSRITPGNSSGTLTVNGAYAQAAGSTYQVELDPATTTSDLIRVNGTATLASGAGLSVVNYTGVPYVVGQRFTILTSTGLTGTYGFGDQVLTPFLSLSDVYDANNAYLTVVQTRTVGDIGTTPNETEVAQWVDSLPTNNPVQSDVLNQESIDAARRALNQISGEIHASAKTALIDESWVLRAAVNDRLRTALGGVGAQPMATLNYGFTADLAPAVRGAMPALKSDSFAVWGQGYGSWGRTDSDGNAARLTRSTGGFLLGADAAVFDNLRFGIIAGYSRSEFDVNNRLSSGESDNYHLGLYGGGQWGALSLRAGASYTWHDVETTRSVTFSALGSNLRSDYDAGTAQVFGELGYRIDLGRVALESFAGLAYVNLRTDGFSETGGAAALTSRSDDTSLGYSTLGLRASTSFALQSVDLTLRGGLAWRHAFGDIDPTATLAFSGSSATIAGLPIARDAAMVEAGLDVAVGRSTTLGVAYTGQLAKDTQDHAFKGVLAVRF
ncbi:autotransporter outer membrane beta-barrel domain-containing protein [Bosea sp. PAMC 26642]|uniref:autotransporter outer membrane beta-barrel domain-containing protein n=1 Tax=Bosea sp. (strain PAMC 26642) TaxID=1792307 RepID=UPI00077063FE|nr:autotransporter domain-containing protein [Bosea sp. PAMC 26642]AMJ61964.1 hypothetical protein AXW83_18155 [Bosea sp. PAMC 26642]